MSSKPTRFHKPDPAIIAKYRTDESLHLLLDGLIRFRIFFYRVKQSIMFIDLCSQFAWIVVFGVQGAELRPYSNWPFKLTFDLAHLHEVLFALNFKE